MKLVQSNLRTTPTTRPGPESSWNARTHFFPFVMLILLNLKLNIIFFRNDFEIERFINSRRIVEALQTESREMEYQMENLH